MTTIGHGSGANTAPLTSYAQEKAFDDASGLLAFLGTPQFRQGRWIFRGQCNAAWSLQPTLERFTASLNDRPDIVESYIDREFRLRAHHYISNTPKSDDSLDWLALMRHYRAPSRLLDFSKSPYVAAFFATAEATHEENAAIWAVDGLAIKRHAGRLLSEASMSVALKKYGESSIKDPSFSFSDPTVFERLFREGLRGVPPPIVVPVEPLQTNERVLLQQGVFLCPVTLNFTFERALSSVIQHAQEGATSTPAVLYKISIFPRAHPNILRELHRMNLSYATLLPGLEG